MARGTKKVGMTGKYGTRYGVKIRKQIKSVSRHRARPARCPECQHDSVKREASGIWLCRHCNLKFAASAYSTRTRSYTKEEAKKEEDAFRKEDDSNLAVELGKKPEMQPEELESEELPREE